MLHNFVYWSGVVDVVTRLQCGRDCVQISALEKTRFLLQNHQTLSGVLPALYSVGIRALFRE